MSFEILTFRIEITVVTRVELDVSMPSFQMSVLACDVIAESSKTNSF